MKRFSLLLIFLAIISSACTSTTQGLWARKTYSETIYQILLSEDKMKVAFIGKHFDYIFPNDESLGYVLDWSHSERLKIELNESFYLNQNQVSGSYRITCYCEDISEKEKIWLFSIGFFVKEESSSSHLLIKEGKLTGTRYISREQPTVDMQGLTTVLKVQVIASHSPNEIAENIALSPIAITADAVQTFDAVVFISIALPFVVAEKLLPLPTPNQYKTCNPCYEINNIKRDSPFWKDS